MPRRIRTSSGYIDKKTADMLLFSYLEDNKLLPPKVRTKKFGVERTIESLDRESSCGIPSHKEGHINRISMMQRNPLTERTSGYLDNKEVHYTKWTSVPPVIPANLLSIGNNDRVIYDTETGEILCIVSGSEDSVTFWTHFFYAKEHRKVVCTSWDNYKQWRNKYPDWVLFSIKNRPIKLLRRAEMRDWMVNNRQLIAANIGKYTIEDWDLSMWQGIVPRVDIVNGERVYLPATVSTGAVSEFMRGE